MILSFEGRTMAEIHAEMEAFLNGSATHCKTAPEQTAEAAVPWGETQHEPTTAAPVTCTAADIRTAFGWLAGNGKATRDELREAMRELTGASTITEIPEGKLGDMMAWCKERGYNA